MRIILNLICLLLAFWTINGQKECFQKKPTTSEAGPLKMSLTDTIKDFESGSYTIVNKNQQDSQRFTCFNITFLYINGKKNYEVVACTCQINFSAIQNVQNYQDKEGLDFSVRFSPNPTVLEGLFIMSKTATWTSTSIHYIISAREDFRVGTFVPETAQFLPCGKESQQLIVNHKLVRPWNASKNLVFGLPFLSGIRTIDSEININFNKSTFDPESSLLQVPMTFDQVQYPVQYVAISYLIVTMESDFQITNIYDLDYIPGDINVFVGMTGVKTVNSSASAKPTANTSGSTSGVLKTALTSASIVNKNKFRDFFEVQGLVIQSTSNLDVLFSSGNYSSNDTIECISAKECLRYDGYMKYYQNQDGFVFKSECILCEKFASYNNVTNRCQCRDLYVLINNACVLKDSACDKTTQVYNEKSKKCQCATGFTEKNGLCVANSICPTGFSLFKGNCYKITRNPDTSTSIIQQTCQSPLTWNDTSKSCQCPANTYLDEVTKKCLSCKQNEIWNQKSKLCQCINGSFRINLVCEFCSNQGFFNGTGCQCLPGYLGNGKVCRQDPTFSNDTLVLTSSSLVTEKNVLSSSSGNLSKEQDSKPILLGSIKLN